jgi:hypothetical protein
MNTFNRRVFMLQAVAGGSLLACGRAQAIASKKIEENDPKAIALGYRNDTAQVDDKKFPKHAAGEKCGGCLAWIGKKTDPWGECDVFADRLVSNGGWCVTYVKAK